MIKGTTKSGFDYTVQEEALDDYELLEELREIDKGNTSLVVDAISRLCKAKLHNAGQPKTRIRRHKNGNGAAACGCGKNHRSKV